MTQIKPHAEHEIGSDANRQHQPDGVAHALRATCSQCSLRELCLPLGLSDEEMGRIDDMIDARRGIRRGDSLYGTGTRFEAIYAIRSGFFKTKVIAEDGHDQVTGFQMAGEILGMDGIGGARHTCDAIALEDSEVCVIPFAALENLSSQITSLQRHVHKIMSREIVRDHGVMLLLGSMRAEQRLAAFLLNLSQRFASRGYAANEFHLRMTREEIGSYLGLKLETVSRTLSRFQEEGLIAVQQKHIFITDTDRLKRVMDTCR